VVIPPVTAVRDSGSTLSTRPKEDTSRPGAVALARAPVPVPVLVPVPLAALLLAALPVRVPVLGANLNRFDVRLASRIGLPGGIAA